MTEHVADQAGFLAALPADDPERQRAERHARSCATCRAALADGARFVTLLQSAAPMPAPSPEAIARTAASFAAGNEDAPARVAAKLPPSLAGVAAVAVTLSWLFQLMVGGGLAVSPGHVVVSLLVLAIAVGCVTILRGNTVLAVAVILATSGMLTALAGTEPALAPAIGVRCMFRELWAAAIPWVAVALFARRRTWQAPPIDLGPLGPLGPLGARGAVTLLAAAGALAGHAGQHLACQVPHADAHLIAFHLSGVVLATVLGAAGARWLPVVAQPRR